MTAESVVWFKEDTVVTADNSASVYVMQKESRTMTLMITSFRASDKGTYHCRAAGASGSLMITDGEWIKMRY